VIIPSNTLIVSELLAISISYTYLPDFKEDVCVAVKLIVISPVASTFAIVKSTFVFV
jgi:hypothetical protein